MILSYYNLDDIKEAIDEKMSEIATFVSNSKRKGSNTNTKEYLQMLMDMEEGRVLLDEDYTTDDQKTTIASYLLNLGKINL